MAKLYWSNCTRYITNLKESICACSSQLLYFQDMYSASVSTSIEWIRLVTRVSSRRPTFPAKFASIKHFRFFPGYLFLLFYCWPLGTYKSVTMLEGSSSGLFLQDDRGFATIPACFPEFSVQWQSQIRFTSCDTVFITNRTRKLNLFTYI